MFRRTRALRIRSGGLSGLPGSAKLLLPAPTFWETSAAALQGVWSQLTEQKSRDAYEAAVESNVIKDTVLENATWGTSITYALFHNLQSPLFRRHKFDAAAFVHAVGPALENFHDTLGCLRNALQEDVMSKTGTSDNKLEYSSIMAPQELSDLFSRSEKDSLGKNQWHLQAEKSPDDLAGRFSKMTSEGCFDALYFTSRLNMLAQVNAGIGANVYVPSSCTVNEVALMHARVMEVDESDPEETVVAPKEEMDGSNGDDDSIQHSVAAQLDVLYEVTVKFEHRAPVEAREVIASESVDESTNKTAAKPVGQVNSSSNETNAKSETSSVTTLAVAVFEGWLHRGDTKKGEEDDLRWKVAVIREPYEFPLPHATVDQNPPVSPP